MGCRIESEAELVPLYHSGFGQLYSFEEKKSEAPKKPAVVSSKQDVQRKNDEDLIMKTMNVLKQPAPAKSGSDSALEQAKKERAAEKKK